MDLLQPTPQDAVAPAPQGDLYLKFELGSGQQLAFPATGVLEVVELPTENITAMPNMHPLLMGTYNLRGEILWLVDLALLFQNTYLTVANGQYPVIVVQDEDAPVGLAVARICGMSWLDGERIQPVGQAPPANLRPFVRGSFPQTDDDLASVLLLDPDTLVRSRPWTQ
ncbi:chemotaxis protein CheW [Anthocerotibacter panamensis]|uniref:chemotaxis protein CheW n=1 Tax=Anthocerotibacter panamensis TaxID=2857077 RepID=UPI001C40260F|nr:chemotaxis protein CheW [Anthocerotibacter panamensis]